MRFAQRVRSIRASGVREFFDKGKQIRNPIDLSIGQADFDVPDEIKEATIEAVRGQCGRYSATEGYAELVDATRSYLQAKKRIGPDEGLMMTTGATGAITLALLALAGPGDEVLVPDPYFVIYYNLVCMVGATPVLYDLHPDYRLRVEEIERRMSDRTRLLILNTPANPTGATFSRREVQELAGLCRERGVQVLSDELYEIFCYDGPHTSIKEFLGTESLLIGGFSKAYGMAGWRLGWAAGDPGLIDCMRTLQQLAYTCAPTLVQRGALAAFELDMSAYVERYRHKRDLLYRGLVDAGYEVVKPTGSFFAFPRVPWGEDEEFCRAALEHKLVIVPGQFFSSRRSHVRISFSVPEETLERGLAVLRQLAERPG